MNKNEKIIKGYWCEQCNNPTVIRDSKIIYGKSYGMIMFCETCKRYVGCHPKTIKPLGRIADKKLRNLKMACHKIFDHIHKTGLINKIYPKYFKNKSNRNKAYIWLASKMNIEQKFCHIGMFNEKQCIEAIEIINKTVE